MDLKQLGYFVAVATEQNFTRAAGRLHIVQSGLSAAIRALEDELGAALLIRSTRRVELTPAGRAFLCEARRVLAAADSARQVIDDLRGLQRGTLSIGMIQGIAPLVDIASLLGRFRAACPQVEVRLTSGGAQSLVDGVRAGALDLAFTQFIGAVPSGVTAWMLACEPLVAVCAPGHRVVGLCAPTLFDIADETFVDLHPDWGTRQLIDQSFAACRVGRRIAYEVNDLPTQLDLVAHGLGVALVPQAIIEALAKPHPVQRLCSVRLAEPEICWELAVVFAHDSGRVHTTATTTLFLRLLQDEVAVLERSAGD